MKQINEETKGSRKYDRKTKKKGHSKIERSGRINGQNAGGEKRERKRQNQKVKNNGKIFSKNRQKKKKD